MRRVLKFVGLFVIVVSLSSLVFSQDVVYTPIELAELRDAYWKSISSIDMEYTEEFIFGGKKIKTLPANRWSMDSSGRERLVYNEVMIATAYAGSTPPPDTKLANKDGDLFNKSDMYFNGGEFYLLSQQGNNLDEVIKVPKFSTLFEASEKPVHAEIWKKKTGDFNFVCPADTWLLFRRWRMSFESVLTTYASFMHFVKECKTTVPVYSKNNKGDLIWTFTIHNPRLEPDKEYIEVVINESKNFFFERVSHHAFDGGKKINGKLVMGQEVVTDYIVKEYMEIEKGRFFPKVFIYQYYISGDKPEDYYQKTYHIKNVSINKPIAESVFDFRIPEYAIVLYHPAIEKNGVRFFVESIWGADNKPSMTFTEPNALNDYMDEMYYKSVPSINRQLPPMGGFSYWRIACCAFGIIFIIVSILITTRKNRKSK